MPVKTTTPIGQFQQSVYIDSELPRLSRLIESEANKHGSIGALIEFMNQRLRAKEWPEFNHNEISDIRRPRENRDRRDGWSDRLYYRLAVGLNIDSDPVIGHAALRLYFLGACGSIEGALLSLKQPAGQSPLTSLYASMPKKDLAKALKVGIDYLLGESTSKINLATFVYAVADNDEDKLNKLFANSTLNRNRLLEIFNGETFTQDELTGVAQWVETINGQTQSEIKELFSVT